MFSNLMLFNEKLERSLSNLNYSMFLIVFTYLVIPTDFMRLVHKLVPYFPKLPFCFNDYLLGYQVICVLTVITFIISNYGLISTDTTAQTTIYCLSSLYTCVLFITLSNNHLYHSSFWDSFSVIFSSHNWFINICIIAIIAFHVVIFMGALVSILESLRKFLVSD